MAAVGGPGGKVAAADFMGELNPALGGDFHDVDVLTAGGAWAVFTIPGKGDELAVGGPGGGGCITAVSHAGDAGAVRVHDVELGKASAAADPGDLGAGLRVVGGRDVWTLVAGDSVGDGTLRIGDPDLGVAGARGGEGQLLTVGGPGRREVGATDVIEADEAAEDEREHAELEAVLAEGGKGDEGVIGRDAGGDGVFTEVSDGVLIGSVVVHHPDFFFTGADAFGVEEFGFGDAGGATAEAEDDVVGKLVG